MNAATRKKYRIASRYIHSGATKQQVFRFPNGFGASVIKGLYSYGGPDGLFELAVLKFTGEDDNFSLCYETPITEDVIGYLTEAEVNKYLSKIYKLPASDVKCPTIEERIASALEAAGEAAKEREDAN